MLDRFLLDLYLSENRTKEIELAQLHSYSRQRGGWAKMLRGVCDRLVHGDAPSHVSEFGFFMRSESSLFFWLWQARLCQDGPAAILGET